VIEKEVQQLWLQHTKHFGARLYTNYSGTNMLEHRNLSMISGIINK